MIKLLAIMERNSFRSCLGLQCCQSFCPDPPINQVVTFCIQRQSIFPPYSIFIWRWCCISLSVFGIIMAVSQTELKNHLRIAWCKMRFWHLQQKVTEVSSIVPGSCFRPPLRSDVCLFHLVYLSQWNKVFLSLRIFFFGFSEH